MSTIKYTIVSGVAPFTAELTPSLIPVNVHDAIGAYEFDDVPNGFYTLIITDSNGCSFQQELTVDPLVTTTTTTQTPTSSIVIGNTQDENLIFNVNGTNINNHYCGYPNQNISTLYLWLKTLDNAPLTSQKVVNYSINSINVCGCCSCTCCCSCSCCSCGCCSSCCSCNITTFKFNSLSDEIHTNIVENVVGPSPSIGGQLILKPGFIETYFQYTYDKNPSMSDFQINLNSNEDWLDTNVPLTTCGINQYGITYIDRNNSIMNF